MIPREILKKIRQIELRTNRLVNETLGGQYHSVFKGQGMNFEEVREYQPGDEVRTIDWNVTARMNHPFVKKFVEERELTVMLVVDLSGSEVESYGKFVTYALYPEAMYSVIVARLENGARINVGYNPWSRHSLDRDLSSICGRYGGGGHPFVGGISFPPEDVQRARHVAREIALELDAAHGG